MRTELDEQEQRRRVLEQQQAEFDQQIAQVRCCYYSRISISQTLISRILRNLKRRSESKIHLIAFSNHNLALETFLHVQITRSANLFALRVI